MDGLIDNDYDDCDCPRCSGFGTVDCRCGGDLCVCTNYGAATCPLCHGEGGISTKEYDAYLDAQRKFRQEMHAALSKANGESGDV